MKLGGIAPMRRARALRLCTAWVMAMLSLSCDDDATSSSNDGASGGAGGATSGTTSSKRSAGGGLSSDHCPLHIPNQHSSCNPDVHTYVCAYGDDPRPFCRISAECARH